jgi:hypothetical protein
MTICCETGSFVPGFGILLINPGTPVSAESKARGRFLTEFLSKPVYKKVIGD